MLHGDLYDIRTQLVREYPTHDLVYVGNGRYNVIEKRRQLRYEGDHNGCPLFLMTDVEDIVFSFNHIPDMRIIRRLREIDVWKHPRGMDGYLDDIEENDRKTQEARDAKQRDEWGYLARENHRRIMGEFDGMTKTAFGGV